jgi:hypothetical protein
MQKPPGVNPVQNAFTVTRRQNGAILKSGV